MAEHDGHRKRLRQRFLQAGIDGFDDLALLELLLQYAIPRKDTNPLAHRLLDRYGNLAAVLEAPARELQNVEGLGEYAAVLLRLVPAAARRYMVERAHLGEILDTPDRCGEYLVPRFFGERDEVVWLLCLDAKLMARDCRMLFRGSVNAAEITVRKIVETALACNATAVVLAHNHTSGLAIPSREDEQTTRRLRTGLDAVGIRLADHIIVAGEDFVSMADSGLLPGGLF